MITFKPIIIPGGRRKDGTYPVKIRVTFRGISRRLPTTLVCTDADLTRGKKIKNATILEKANELIARMRATTTDLSPFTLDAWGVDEVVRHIRTRLESESFRLDFFAFADEILADKIPHTSGYYKSALNALARYLGRRTIDINDITRPLLLDFAEFIGGTKAARNLSYLAYIHREARDRYNDEDAGLIRIPRQPFKKLPKAVPMGKGQKALSLESFQAIINIHPANEYEAIALAAFLLSFLCMGANMADLYAQKLPVSGIWSYNRCKTGVYAEVRINAKIDTFVGLLQDGGGSPWWLPALHRYGTSYTATACVNRRLRTIAEREGMEPFTFYAARKSWATFARRLGIEKATIDDALAHTGGYRMADIYAEKNYYLCWEANEKVQSLFKWPDKYRTKKEDIDGK